MWSDRNSCSLLVEIQNCKVTLESNLTVSCKTKHVLTILPSSCAPWYLLEQFKNKSTWKPVSVKNNFVHNRSKFGRCLSASIWIDKLLYVQMMEYCLTLKRNKLSSYTASGCTTWKTHKCLLLNEKKPMWKGYLLYNSNCESLQKRKKLYNLKKKKYQ